MLRALRSLSLAAVASGMLALTLVAFAWGSTSVSGARGVAKDLRWAALAALLAAAVALVLARRPRGRLPRAVLVPAGSLAAVALLSTGWSVEPELSLRRSVSLAMALAAAAALGLAVSAEAALLRTLATGLLAGAATVAVLGLLVFAASPDTAMQWATVATPARFRGLGENPNTMPMLYALVLPFGVWLAATAPTSLRRLGLSVAVALLLVSIFLGSSRGAVLASLAGVGALALLSLRGWRLACAAVAITAVLVAGFALMEGPKWDYTRQAPVATKAPPGDALPPVNLDLVNDPNEIGRPRPGVAGVQSHRTLFGSSGRAQAWDGALRQALERPLLGYGFGTEERVFVDRYYTFQGARPENSYLGFALQLGLAGLALYVALAAAAVAAVRRARGHPGASRGAVAACAGVVSAGYVLAVFQSYAYSIGNVATVTFWTALFLLAGLAGGAERGR